MKKQEIRGMLTDVDKEGAASVSFNDFVEMVTPKVLARDPKVRPKGPLAERQQRAVVLLSIASTVGRTHVRMTLCYLRARARARVCGLLFFVCLCMNTA